MGMLWIHTVYSESSGLCNFTKEDFRPVLSNGNEAEGMWNTVWYIKQYTTHGEQDDRCEPLIGNAPASNAV